MATARGSYPHPVLDRFQVDASTVFEAFNFSYQPSAQDVRITFQVRMDDSDMRQLIEDGAVRLSARWTCSATMSSDELGLRLVNHLADSDAYEAWLDHQDIRDKVIVEVQLIATRPINGYRLTHQHEDYGGGTFEIQPGDILGYDGPFPIEPGKLFDPMKPPVGALFRFISQDKQARRLKVDFGDRDHILVKFDPELLIGLESFAGKIHMQISLVVLPALMQAITFVRDNEGADDEDLSDKAWYEPLVKLVNDHGGFDEPAFDLAQEILAFPFDTSLRSTAESEDE